MGGLPQMDKKIIPLFENPHTLFANKMFFCKGCQGRRKFIYLHTKELHAYSTIHPTVLHIRVRLRQKLQSTTARLDPPTGSIQSTSRDVCDRMFNLFKHLITPIDKGPKSN